MPVPLTDAQLATLRAVCDTVVPSIERPDDPDGFWARTATDVGADQALLQTMRSHAARAAGRAGRAARRARAPGLRQGLAAQPRADPREPLARLDATRPPASARSSRSPSSSPTACRTRRPARTRTGRRSATPARSPPRRTRRRRSRRWSRTATRRSRPTWSSSAPAPAAASSPGASPRAGLKVVVLEAGRYTNEADFNQLEIPAYQNRFWRGGPTPDRRPEHLAAGRLVPRRRHGHQLDELAAHQGLGPRAVGERARPRGRRHRRVRPPPRRGVARAVRSTTSARSSTARRRACAAAPSALGWSFVTVNRNWDCARHDPAMAGYLGFGDQSGRQAVDAQDLPAGRRRPRRRHPRRQRSPSA